MCHIHPRGVPLSAEYAEGGTLDKVLETAYAGKNAARSNPAISEKQIWQWVVQLSDALQYLHRSMLVLHRDIKPMNV